MRAATLLPCLALIAAQVCAAAPAAEASSELLTRHAGMSARRGDLVRRAASPPGGEVDYYNPLNRTGGSMLTIIEDLADIPLGEPINVIISGRSSASVLSTEGFLLWSTSINFGVSCLGQAEGGTQAANLGDGHGNVTQGTGNGDNGVLRWNYGDAYIGTCKETFVGGNHFRWYKQNGPKADSGAWFLAVSNEGPLSDFHVIVTNGYNSGRDELVGNATKPGGTNWGGNFYETTVEYIPAGVLLNDTSDGINHPYVALPGQNAQDGRVALLTVIQTVISPEATNLRVQDNSDAAASLTPACTLSLGAGAVALGLLSLL